MLPKTAKTESRSSSLEPDMEYGHCCVGGRLCLPMGDAEPEHPSTGGQRPRSWDGAVPYGQGGTLAWDGV